MLPPTDFYENLDYGHGRIETRKGSVLTDFGLLENSKQWVGLASIVRIERERYFKATGGKESEISFYISTLTNAQKIENGVRKHWGIENKVHWVLDVAFNEDLSRKREGYADKTFLASIELLLIF